MTSSALIRNRSPLLNTAGSAPFSEKRQLCRFANPVQSSFASSLMKMLAG